MERKQKVTQVLRRIARGLRHESRRTGPVLLSAVVAAVVAVTTIAVGLMAPVGATIVVVGCVAAVVLATTTAMWVSVSRRLRTVREGTERVEVVQRRILAAVERVRLEEDRRRIRGSKTPSPPLN
ncbi:MAG TPA: hypothetical protein H9881_12890 [Candidatus Stackebrandtia excrementipullorum]|nr:hypothetical protein [Candidatus Stackebrandtia excrementipullorum]